MVVDIKVLQNRTVQDTLPTFPLTLLWWAVRAGYFSCIFFSQQCFCECFTFLCDLLRWTKLMGNALCVYMKNTHMRSHTPISRQIRVSNQQNCTFEQKKYTTFCLSPNPPSSRNNYHWWGQKRWYFLPVCCVFTWQTDWHSTGLH